MTQSISPRAARGGAIVVALRGALRGALALAPALALAAALTAAVTAQQAQPPTSAPDTFRSGTRTVEVYATVLDANGRLVPDLEQPAFTVKDNGTAQPLTVFGNYVQPITAVMMIDRSGSMQEEFGLVEKAAEAFVNELGPKDKARIGSFSNRIQVDPREFTSDHGQLLEILRSELQEAGPTPLWNAVNVGITALAHQEGRRVILVFTDGMDRPGNTSSMNSSLKEVMNRAEHEDVMVYAIGLAGHNGPMGRGGGYGPTGGGRRGGGYGGGGRRGGMGGFGGGMGGGMGRRGGMGGMGGGMRNNVAEKPDDGLAKIAAATGGGYFELTSTQDLESTFKRVADELHHQYLLGFTPAKLDGKVHKLEVRTDGAGATVRARQTYVATPDR